MKGEARTVPGGEGDDDGSGPPRPQETAQRGREERVYRQERPRVLGDGSRIRQRQLGRVSVDRREPVPLPIPPDRQVGDRGIGSKARARARKIGGEEEERGGYPARREVDEADRRGGGGTGRAAGRESGG